MSNLILTGSRDLEDVLFAFAEDAPAPGAAEAGGAAADDQQHGVRKRGKGRTEAAHPTDTSDMAPMSPGNLDELLAGIEDSVDMNAILPVGSRDLEELLAQLAQPSPSERPTTAAAAAAAAAAATMTAAAPAAGGAGAEDEERRKRKRAADRTEEEWAAHHAEQDRRRGVLLGAIRDRGHAIQPAPKSALDKVGRSSLCRR
ncbi:hypothetical protein MNEG_14553 [Monoraphidium neglectum]|uniref:Uncharacterized protein n=1 Tax=Monoraphidium neglectum TaxID=145388 RepID=A0A0D2MDX6_9CHLO|nr:hypothetical protein MNEG_14553 [Monoraphidium neglectum]KIY93410.1 hypothetical protein MNEG_14553 [Monoraphidium neglectum]|eukprot:XP_013892430.1 hypothetical protein MNEG_14553 [Monoraphidium neglectum]